MEKKSKSIGIPSITFTGDVTVNGPMFDIHDNQHVHVSYPGRLNQEPAYDFEYVNLVFFDEKLFGTYERQLALHNLLKEAFKRMSLDTGRDLVAIFIAYHFLKDQLLNMKCYTDFLQDTDSLLPGMLTKIKEDETSRTQRYKAYAESLATECEKWFIDNGCLPDKKEWKAKSYNYAVDTERRHRIQELVTKLYQGMKEITR